MIRKKELSPRLFYADEDVRRPRGKRLKRIDAAVGDWDALVSPLKAAFSEKVDGRPTDPVVYFKIFLIGSLENIERDTDLAERVDDSLSIRDFIGYRLDESTPDHSSISRVRALFGEGLEEVLSKVVDLCARAGLVDGKECAEDSSLVAANASKASLHHLDTCESTREYTARLKREAPEKKPRVHNKDFVSSSDADARLASKPSAPPDLYYKVTHVVDSKCQVILAADCSCADVHDTDCAIDPLQRAAHNLEQSGLKLCTVVADGGYDDGDFHAQVESLGLTPITNHYSRERSDQIPKSQFRYDSDHDVYICPQGQLLRWFRKTPDGNQYKAKLEICRDCPFKSECLLKGEARTVLRYANEDARSRNMARCRTKEGKRALRRRKQVVEPTFAYMKERGGLRRMNCRGLRRAKVKVGFAAIGWNLLKLAAAVAAKTRASKRALQTILTGLKPPFGGRPSTLSTLIRFQANRFRLHRLA